MTSYNVWLREPLRIRICLVQANLGKISPRRFVRRQSLCRRRSVPKLL